MANKENNNNTQQSPWIGIVFIFCFAIVILIIIFGERSTYIHRSTLPQKEDLVWNQFILKIKDFFIPQCQYKLKTCNIN